MWGAVDVCAVLAMVLLMGASVILFLHASVRLGLVDHLSSDPEDWLTWAKPPNPGADVLTRTGGVEGGGLGLRRVINNIKMHISKASSSFRKTRTYFSGLLHLIHVKED